MRQDKEYLNIINSELREEIPKKIIESWDYETVVIDWKKLAFAKTEVLKNILIKRILWGLYFLEELYSIVENWDYPSDNLFQYFSMFELKLELWDSYSNLCKEINLTRFDYKKYAFKDVYYSWFEDFSIKELEWSYIYYMFVLHIILEFWDWAQKSWYSKKDVFYSLNCWIIDNPLFKNNVNAINYSLNTNDSFDGIWKSHAFVSKIRLGLLWIKI